MGGAAAAPMGGPVAGMGGAPSAPMQGIGTFTEQVAPLPAAQSKPAKVSPLARLLDTRPKKILVLGGGGVLLLLIVLVVIGGLMKPKPPVKKAAATVTKPKGPTPEKVFQQATTLMRQKKWSQAAVLLKQLRAINPRSEVYAQQSSYVQANLAATQVLAKAHTALKAKNLVVAQVRLFEDFAKDKRFMQGERCRVDSDVCRLFHAQVRHYRVLKAAPLVAAARELAGAKRTKKQALSKVIEALKIAPESYAAQKLRHELDGTPITAEPDPDLDRLLMATQPTAGPARPGPTASSGGGGGGYGGGGLPKAARTLYVAKDFIGALGELNGLAAKRSGYAASHLRSLAAKVKTVGGSLKRGDAIMASNPGQALTLFKAALAADSSLGGAHQSAIKGRLFRVARAHAGSLFSSGRYGACYRMVLFARRYGSEGLDRLLGQLSAKAKELFDQGYVAHSSNPSRARSLWNQVVAMVPASNTYARKARSWLAKLSSGSAGASHPVMTHRPRRAVYHRPARRWTAPRRRHHVARARPRPRPMRAPPRRRYFLGGGEDEDE